MRVGHTQGVQASVLRERFRQEEGMLSWLRAFLKDVDLIGSDEVTLKEPGDLGERLATDSTGEPGWLTFLDGLILGSLCDLQLGPGGEECIVMY